MNARSGSIVACGLSPHPPVIVPEVGGEDAKVVAATSRGLAELSRRLVAKSVDTLVLVGPHGPCFSDAIACAGDRIIKGDLSRFGAKGVAVSFSNDTQFAALIANRASEVGIRLVMLDERMRHAYRVSEGLDHGAVVPLYFLKDAGYKGAVVSLSMGMYPLVSLYEFGKCIAAAASDSDKRVAVLASGDLSHRLTKDAPAGYSPRGKQFDMLVVDALKQADPSILVNMDADLAERAGECGLRPAIIMMGSLDGRKVESEVISYEGPFGVGYCVAYLEPVGKDPRRQYLAKWKEESDARRAERRAHESGPVRLAREALEGFLRTGRRISASSAPADLKNTRAGVFVSLKKHGQLRGCIGTTEPTTQSLAEEVIQNAISAGTEDPRFPPVEIEEMDDLVISVDVLGPSEPVRDTSDLDPKTYGVIVEKGTRKGLLLPYLPGVDSVDEQLSIARQKAGIGKSERDVKIYRFKVTRYH